MNKISLFQTALRRRLFGWLALCLLFYTVADLGSLHRHTHAENEVCANSIFHHHDDVQSETANADESDLIAASTPDHQSDDAPTRHCTECFCSSFHVLTAHYFKLDFPVALVYEQNHFSLPHSVFTESHLHSLFRPPRSA